MILRISLCRISCQGYPETYRWILSKGVGLSSTTKPCSSIRTMCTAKTSAAITDTASLPWSLSSAVCIERIPTLVPELTELQSKMLETLRQLEYEQSKLSEHELRQIQDKERAALVKSGAISNKESVILTAADEEDKWNKELAEFKPASKKTVADETNDTKSTQRCQDRPLYLLVKRKLGDTLHWDLPTTIRVDGESMRLAAERAVEEHCGKLNVQVLGNAPWAVYKYKYPRKIQEKTGKRGEKVFIYKAIYTSGKVEVQTDKIADFHWALQDEMWKMLDDHTKRSLENIIYDEEP